MRMPPSSKTLTSAPATTHRFRRPLLRRGLRGRFRCRLRAHRRLECALLRLVRLALGNGSHVREGGPIRSDALPAVGAGAEMLGDDADHDACLGGAESGQRREAPLQLLGISGLSPDASRIATVLIGNHLAESVDPPGHARGEAMQRGRLPERRLDLGGIHARDLGGIDGTQPFLHAQWPLEGPFDRHLLVQAEADQQSGGVLADNSVRVRVTRPLESRLQRTAGHSRTVPRRGPGLRRVRATAYTRQMSWLGRLFGSKPPPAPTNSVVVASDLVPPLVASGADLTTAVDSALRAYLDAQAKALAAGEPERIPFWLRRDAERPGDLEDELRDRVIQRRAAEEETR